jgi:hypothetical protein
MTPTDCRHIRALRVGLSSFSLCIRSCTRPFTTASCLNIHQQGSIHSVLYSRSCTLGLVLTVLLTISPAAQEHGCADDLLYSAGSTASSRTQSYLSLRKGPSETAVVISLRFRLGYRPLLTTRSVLATVDIRSSCLSTSLKIFRTCWSNNNWISALSLSAEFRITQLVDDRTCRKPSFLGLSCDIQEMSILR